MLPFILFLRCFHFFLFQKIVKKLSTEEAAYDTFLKINDSATSNDPKHYGGDFEINKEDGTSHTSVLAPNGDAVAVTSTINLYFGSKIMSPSTGIIFNDQMDDFSSPNITNEFGLPPSPHNFIVAGKRPQSSICPSILVDAKGIPRIVAGATGGTKITSAAAFVRFFPLFTSTLHSVWKSHKKSHLNFSILAFSTKFCPIKTDLSGNTVWPQASGFQKLAKLTIFGIFN